MVSYPSRFVPSWFGYASFFKSVPIREVSIITIEVGFRIRTERPKWLGILKPRCSLDLLPWRNFHPASRLSQKWATMIWVLQIWTDVSFRDQKKKYTSIALSYLGVHTLSPRRGGRKGGTNTAIPHMVAREYRNTASKFSQIPKPQLQMGKSWRCQY